MSKMNSLSAECIDISLNKALKSRNYPVICRIPNCLRRMLKRSYVSHCLKFHNFTVENDLPQCYLDSELLTFL